MTDQRLAQGFVRFALSRLPARERLRWHNIFGRIGENRRESMIKHYCDGCDKEITEENRCLGGTMVKDRLGATLNRNGKKLQVELLGSTDGTANAGDWCRYCVLDAFRTLDNRPRPRAVR